MTCEAPQRDLVAFLATGSLAPAEREAAAAHAASCAECGEELRGARELAGGLRGLHLTADEVVEAAWEGTRLAHLDDCPACAADVATVARTNAELAAGATAPSVAGGKARRLADALASARFTFPALAAVLLISVTLGVRLDRVMDENARLAADAASGEQARRERDDARRQSLELRSALDRASEPQVNVPIVNLEPAGGLRGEGAVLTPVVPRQAQTVTLVLHVAEDRPGRAHAVEIRDARRRAIWEGAGLVKTDYGAFTVSVPLRLLPAGDYEVRLLATDRGQSTPIETYAFRVR
jgi:hypothetical protein